MMVFINSAYVMVVTAVKVSSLDNLVVPFAQQLCNIREYQGKAFTALLCKRGLALIQLQS